MNDDRQSMDAGLARLAEVDPVSAEQIRLDLAAALPGGAFPPPVSRDEQVSWRVEAEDGAVAADIVVVLGATPGGELSALIERAPRSARVLLLEYAPRNAAHLPAVPAIEAHLRSGRLVLALGADEAYVETRFLALVNMRRAPNVRILDGPPAGETALAFYRAALRRVRETIHLQTFNLGTMIDRGALWQYNTMRNLCSLVANPGVAALRDAFAGKPALVLGAGPSLNAALRELPALAAGFVVISTGTALRPTRKAGLRPDLVVAVDGSAKTAPQFETQCDDIYLACSSLVYPPVIPEFRGVFSASMATNPLSRWLDGFGTPKGDLTAAGTVTTSAMDLAFRMGCDPIVVTGFDLSFADDGTTHASGTMYHGSRMNPEQLIRVPGNAGRDVPTTEQFRCYILLAEEYIERHPGRRFVNLTAGGALIRGMDVVPPAGLARFAAEPFDAFDAVRRAHAAYDGGSVAEVRAALERARAALAGTADRARQAASLCNCLLLMLKRPRPGDADAAREILERLAVLDEAMSADAETAPFIEMSLWPAGFAAGTARNDMEARHSDAALVNARARALYEQIAGAAGWSRNLIDETLREMAVASARGARSLGKEPV